MGEANKDQVVQTLTDLDSEVETYDIKVAVKNKGKHDVRLKFVDWKPKIVAVKRDEEKLLITDVLCLHRYSDSIYRYCMAGNFHGVLIFVIFVVDLAVTKITTHEN